MILATTTITTIPGLVTTTTLPSEGSATTTTIPAEQKEDYNIILIIASVLIIGTIGWIYFHGHKKLPISKPKPIHPA